MNASDRSLLNIINFPKFQLPNLLVLLSGIAVTAIIFGSFVVLQSRLLFSLAETEQELQVIRSILWTNGLLCAGILCLATLLLVLWSLILTHRMVGPLPRVKNEIETMQDENKVHLLFVRDYDYLQEFFEKINTLLIRLIRDNEEYEIIEDSHGERLMHQSEKEDAPEQTDKDN
ncbi:MAG: hypothetical protein ABEK50_01130 [bacterium]